MVHGEVLTEGRQSGSGCVRDQPRCCTQWEANDRYRAASQRGSPAQPLWLSLAQGIYSRNLRWDTILDGGCKYNYATYFLCSIRYDWGKMETEIQRPYALNQLCSNNLEYERNTLCIIKLAPTNLGLLKSCWYFSSSAIGHKSVPHGIPKAGNREKRMKKKTPSFFSEGGKSRSRDVQMTVLL